MGCHSDLWRPFENGPSKLAVHRGWAERLAPLQPAGAVLGALKREWIKRTGLPAGVKVYCGLHDSNAALLAARSIGAMAARDSTVLSTGTWFVAMRSPLLKSAAQTMRLPETRDCLVNVDVEGAPIPSARFMGGREIEVLMDAEHAGTDQPQQCGRRSDPEEGRSLKQCEHALRVAEAGELIVPSAVPGVGPFPNAKRRTLGPISDIDQAIAKSRIFTLRWWRMFRSILSAAAIPFSSMDDSHAPRRIRFRLWRRCVPTLPCL